MARKTAKKSARIGGKGDKFVLSPKHQKMSFLGWMNRETGELVNLVGDDAIRMTSPTKNNPSKEVTYRAATQEDLRTFWQLGAMQVGNEWISNQGVVIKIDGGDDEESSNEG
jgi:hypothetical protein